MSSFVSVVKLMVFSLIFSLFTKFKVGIQCLLKFPGLFTGGIVTKEGASRVQCEQSSFKMTFITHTENNEKLNSTMIHGFTGPDPGYIGTSKMSIACVIMLLKEYDCLPVKWSSSAVAFGRTLLMDSLEEEGISLSQK